MSCARVFIASSLDGFIAGPNDELDWLAGGTEVEDTFTPFMAQVGAVLMGRRTYDVIAGLEGEWAYGDTPMLIATTRPLESKRASVRPVTGSIEDLVREAKDAANGRDVYVDGGALIRSALDANLIESMAITVIPMVLGSGIPLFAGSTRRHALELLSTRSLGGGLVELNYRPQS